MPKPKPTYNKEPVPISFSIERWMVVAFKKKCDELGFNRSEVIRQFMNDFITNY